MTLYKKIKISFAAGAALVVLAGTSCKKVKEFGDLNQDPTATTAPIPPALLTNVLSNMATFTWDAGSINTISGLYSQYFSETQYTDVSTYSKQSPNWDDYFGGSSTNVFTQVGYLNNLQAIISFGTNPTTTATAATYGSVNNQLAIARILKAYIFSQLTDAYGDMPYFNALKHDNGTLPYDKQSAIYTDLFKELTQAVAQFDGGSISGDILFSGDVTKWKKFANSLHALLALHLTKVDAATGKKEFAAALAASGGVIEEGGDVAQAFPGGNYLSPIYKYYNVTKRFDYALSKTMTDQLKNTSDARAKANVYGTSAIGFPFGLSRNAAVDFSNNNVGFAQVMNGQANSTGTDAFPVMTAGEIYLARAEAAQLGWTGEDAAAMYALGIKSNWEFWKVYDATAYGTFMSSTAISLSSGSALQKIATQEWLAHFPAGLRGWTVWRRTGFPVLTPSAAAVNGGTIPRRMSYGPNEYSYNKTNVGVAAALYTVSGDPDSQLGRMWWDVQ